MYYSGYFRNTDTSTDKNGQLFKVVIITNFIDKEFDYGGELLLTDSPFTVSYESEDGNLFKPYKCSSATVGLLQNEYNFNFNTSKGNNVMVMLLKWNGKKEESVKDSDLFKTLNKQLQIDKLCYELEWIGYATPNVYSQEYENYFDSFELEAQDALSTLQYFPFKVIENNKYPFITFIEIIKYLLIPVSSYKHIYVPDTLKIPTSDDSDLLSYLIIDQRNFFDEDEKPRNSLEVVEELMKFLSLTIIPQGDSLYIIDYNGLKRGFNDYYKYSTLNTIYPFPIDDTFNLEANKVELKDEIEILKEDFSSTGTKLTLQGITNKYSVKDSLYSYDTITPLLDDTLKLVDSVRIEHPKTISTELLLGDNLQYANGLVLAEVGNKYITDEGYEGCNDIDKYIKYVENAISPISQQRAIIKHENVDERLYVFSGVIYNHKFQKIYVKYVGYDNGDSVIDNSELITYWYYQDSIKGNNLEYGEEIPRINETKSWGWDVQDSYVGSQLMLYQIESVEGYEEFDNHPKKIELKPCIVMGIGKAERNNNLRNMLIKKQDKQKMFTVKSKSLSLGSGDYIVLNASMNFSQTPEFIPKEQDEVDTDVSLVKYNYQCCGLTFTTADGEKYSWNGSKWCDGDGFTFDVELDCMTLDEAKGDKSKCKGAFSKAHEFKSLYCGRDEYNFKDLFNVEGGLIIPSPMAFSEDDIMLGQLEFTFYRFYGLSDWMAYYVVVEDLEMNVITQSDRNLYVSSNDDTDTEYSNVINDDLVEVESKTECNISTWDMKQPNYSSINFYRKVNLDKTDKLGDREILRLRHIFNKSTGEVLRAEEHIIENQVNQYSTPSVNLNLNLHKFPKPYSVYKYSYFKGKKFILDGCELDYVNNSYNINIVEKK